jgi:hypothetical protein
MARRNLDGTQKFQWHAGTLARKHAMARWHAGTLARQSTRARWHVGTPRHVGTLARIARRHAGTHSTLARVARDLVHSHIVQWILKVLIFHMYRTFELIDQYVSVSL